MTEPEPCCQPYLPKPAVNLALRVNHLHRLQNGRRHHLEIIFNGRQWLLIVDGAKVEDLGVADEES
jgi:hypothetical protein